MHSHLTKFFPDFNSNISIDSHVIYLFEQNCWCDLIFGANLIDKFGFTINYYDRILTWVDHNIPRKDPFEYFRLNMFNNLNDELCRQKRQHIWL